MCLGYERHDRVRGFTAPVHCAGSHWHSHDGSQVDSHSGPQVHSGSTALRWHVVYEEGAKFFVLLAWCTYLVLTTLAWARARSGVGLAPGRETGSVR